MAEMITKDSSSDEPVLARTSHANAIDLFIFHNFTFACRPTETHHGPRLWVSKLKMIIVDVSPLDAVLCYVTIKLREVRCS